MSQSPNRQEMELIAAAAGAERANRPRWLLGVAVAVLVIAAVYLIASIGSLARARAVRDDATRQLEVVQRRADAYRAKATEIADRASPEDPGTVTKLENLGRAVGLEVRVNEQLEGYDQRGLRRRKLRASLPDADPADFLSWLHAVMDSEDLRGIQISNLTMRPQTPRPGASVGWNINVAFDRLERRP